MHFTTNLSDTIKLDEDETPEAMDETLEADILEKIPEKMSEM